MNRKKQDNNGSRGARIAHDEIDITLAQSFRAQQGIGSGGQRARLDHRNPAKKNSDFGRHHQQQHSYPSQRRHEHSRGYYSQPGGRVGQPSSSIATTELSTSGAVKEIPGFYFDPDKKKYFKITANHVFGSQHPYSQQSIKEKVEVKV